jgi:CRISPR-associated protein Cas2
MTRQHWLISYDIVDPRRLRRVARTVKAVGVRVHYSLYCCELDDRALFDLQRRLARLIDPAMDAVLYLPWCTADRTAVRHFGASGLSTHAAGWIV